ncbi:hypothetical protein Ancab_034997 [Ancistrocladus abbreviatus]
MTERERGQSSQKIVRNKGIKAKGKRMKAARLQMKSSRRARKERKKGEGTRLLPGMPAMVMMVTKTSMSSWRECSHEVGWLDYFAIPSNHSSVQHEHGLAKLV